MRPGHRIAAWAALALVLGCEAGCDAPRATPCPGQRVATLHFQGDPVVPESGACPFDGGSIAFTATLSYGSATTAFLCVDRAEAEPLRGTREGDHVYVASPAAPANVKDCACAVQVIESVDGGVLRVDGGATGFAGELTNEIAPPDGGASGGACELPDGGAGCGVPCELRWKLSGTP
jgi:hypothetical protein